MCEVAIDSPIFFISWTYKLLRFYLSSDGIVNIKTSTFKEISKQKLQTTMLPNNKRKFCPIRQELFRKYRVLECE